MRSEHYKLDGKKLVPCTLMEWAEFFETFENRIVAQHTLNGVMVSTVFLGVDHAWGCGKPQLFETMIFGGPHDGYQERCETWEEAEGMHSQAMKMAKRESA